MQHKLVDLLEREERLLTVPEIAYKLRLPVRKIEEDLDSLKTGGVVREVNIEDLMEEWK